MKNFLLLFFALVICSPAYSWERFGPDAGYRHCVDDYIRGGWSEAQWNL